MKTSPAGVALIKSFEDCELRAYPDPGTGSDPYTIGFGHTGPEVIPGLTISQEEADELLALDLEKVEVCVSELVEVEVTQPQFDALVALAYNIGCSALGGSSLMKLLNAGDTAGAAGQFPRWCKAGGKVMAGLSRRRAAERALFEGTA